MYIHPAFVKLQVYFQPNQMNHWLVPDPHHYQTHHFRFHQFHWYPFSKYTNPINQTSLIKVKENQNQKV